MEMKNLGVVPKSDVSDRVVEALKAGADVVYLAERLPDGRQRVVIAGHREDINGHLVEIESEMSMSHGIGAEGYLDEVLRDGEVVEDIDDRLTAYRVLATPLQAISALNQIAAEWDMKAPTR